MKKEIWKPIFGEIYAASNRGRIKRVVRYNNTPASGVISQQVQNSGYLVVHLYADNKRSVRLVHRLVAEAFLGVAPAGYDVNHKDGVKTNNGAGNLEYVTRRENLRHAVRLGTAKSGEKCAWSKLTAAGVLDIRARYVPGNGGELAWEYGISPKTLHGVVSRANWKQI